MPEPLVLEALEIDRAGGECASHTKHAAAVSGGRAPVYRDC
jgi:hypothetical protein